MIDRTVLLAAALLAQPLMALPALATPDQPFARLAPSRPAVVEASWTPLRLPNGDSIALAGGSYLLAINDEWGFGPTVYGAAKGNYGGIFTVGFTAQRRWRLGQNTHLAAGFFAGAGGGLSSNELRFGGGLMLRPELSVRTEIGAWYVGAALAQVSFPSGNVRGSSLGLVVGRSNSFASFAPGDVGKSGRASTRTGLGFDEIALLGGLYQPSSSTLNRSGQPSTGRMGHAGADLRQYIVDGSWWGVEAAGAAQGGADGYMEMLATLGQDWAVGHPRVRVGGQVGAGLGGGGNVDSGTGWLLRAGPTLRWITPWGPTVRLDAGWTKAVSGQFAAQHLRVGLAFPLDVTPQLSGSMDGEAGIVRNSQVLASVQHLPQVRFKDGSREAVSMLAVLMTREFSPSFYGVAQAGSAAVGKAGAYSFGLFGLGLQSPYVLGRTRFGAELLAGAAGGGGVAVGGGAVMQAEAWAAWEFGEADRLRLRTGLGYWRSLRDATQATPMLNVSLGYAFGTLAR